jgi:hypothetical protein
MKCRCQVVFNLPDNDRVVVVVITYDCCTLTLLAFRLLVLRLDEEAVHRVGWAGPSSSF